MHPAGVYSIDDARLQALSREISWHDARGSESRDSTMADARDAARRIEMKSALPEHGSATAAASSWTSVPQAFRSTNGSLPQPWEDIFGPLRCSMIDDLVLVAQCGQSIDARVATSSGHSHYINGEGGLAHLHRLRSLVDAVVIGVGTAVLDDPQLTVRRVAGPSPARVVVDPNGRLPATARVLAADGIRRLVITAAGTPTQLPGGVEIVPLARDNGQLSPAAIVAALAARGFRRILIEGGADTVSRFLAARCLDRLHILVAPIILGTGRSSLTLPAIERVDEAMRAPMRAHVLDSDVLLDCDLSAQRVPIGRAKISR
jgi:diaminohydroxyphosphoribosylaminopyrimidine deaminase / 5-amino-6-(5-phosphoribosylamino)uracil reductase